MKVDSTADLTKAWVAHNVGDYARSERVKANVRYHGPLLYSRQTPVARFHRDTRGGLYVLASGANYSPSTTRQLGRASQACHKLNVPFFRVDLIGAQGGWSTEPGLSTPELHAQNFANMLAEYVKLVEAIKRRWRHEPFEIEWRMNDLHRQHQYMVHYAALSGTSSASLKPIDQTLADIRIYSDAKLKLWNDPKSVAARDRAHARRIAKAALGLDAIAA